jgi:hypothetical protein
VGDDVPVDSETFMVTSSISLSDLSAQSSGGDHRGRVCVYVHRGECIWVYISVYVCIVFL